MKEFLLIDDHFVVRAGIKTLLSELYKPSKVYEAGDSETAIEMLKQRDYAMILLDVHVPKNDMLGLMDYIHTGYPSAKVLIFSMSSESIYAKRFLKAGAKGFLSKDAGLEETVKAINLVVNNRRYISESLVQRLAEETLTDAPANPFDKLSAREFEIATMMLSGQPLSDIGRSLHLQPSTVGTHKAKLFQKMEITNILELKELASMYIHK